MKVGDKIRKVSDKEKKGEIYAVDVIYNTPFYRIDFYNEKIIMFNSELIELDIEEIRNEKLKSLGI